MAKTIGERLLERRRELGLNQTQVAKLAGIGQSTYSELETDTSKKPEGPTLVGLSLALRLPARFILTGKGGTEMRFAGTEQEEELLDIVRTMSGDQVELLLGIARQIQDHGGGLGAPAHDPTRPGLPN